MSVKSSKYLVVIILSIFITLLAVKSVDAVCYVSQSDCSVNMPATQYTLFQDSELQPIGTNPLCAAALDSDPNKI